jgi:osmoprotectant transport system permease protein
VVLTLGGLAVAATGLLDGVRIQPNRIVSGTAYGLPETLGLGPTLLVVLPLLVMMALAARPTRGREAVMLLLATVMLTVMPWALSGFIGRFIDASAGAARAALSAGSWLVGFALILMVVDLRQRLQAGAAVTAAILAVTLGSLVAALTGGALDTLALVQEYIVRRAAFAEAILNHLALVGIAVGTSLIVAVALALWMRRVAAVRQGVLGVLSFIQTIPSLALFGLLLAPLAWLASRFPLLSELGIQGIGWAPALLALVGYSLLPMTRNTFIALDGVEPAVIEAARGMGLAPLQVFFRVRLPLALPLLIEGIRITTVQAIGLAAVAALIGAGGLGTFIFQGLGQAAMNLVVLGALPIVLMAMAVDALLKALADAARRGETHDRT